MLKLSRGIPSAFVIRLGVPTTRLRGQPIYTELTTTLYPVRTAIDRKERGENGDNHFHRQTFPLAVPPTTQFLLRWKTATAGTAVTPSPPSCASWSPVPL